MFMGVNPEQDGGSGRGKKNAFIFAAMNDYWNNKLKQGNVMALRTGTYAFLEMLRAEGVKYIFGNPGTSKAAIMDALTDYPDINYILVVQEGIARFWQSSETVAR